MAVIYRGCLRGQCEALKETLKCHQFWTALSDRHGNWEMVQLCYVSLIQQVSSTALLGNAGLVIVHLNGTGLQLAVFPAYHHELSEWHWISLYLLLNLTTFKILTQVRIAWVKVCRWWEIDRDTWFILKEIKGLEITVMELPDCNSGLKLCSHQL